MRRRWLFRFQLVLLPFALLGLLEICLRLGDYGFDTHLFKRLKIGTADYFVQNEDFGRRFFPSELARHLGPVRFPVHKARGTFRIFVLGESAAMGDPDQSFAPDRYLAILLHERYPATRFEVINVAFTAINSHVIVPIARECAAHEGDLWLVYMGNNEMVGPFGAATVFGPQAPSLPYARLTVALQRSRVVQWVMEQGRKFSSQKDQAAVWGGMGMFLNNLIPPDSPRKERVYLNFQRNLDDIVRAGIRSKAKVLLNTVAVNLKDCPPFASSTNTQLSLADRGRFDQLYTNGFQAAEQKEWAKGTELFEQASHLDIKSAELQYHWGKALLAQTNLAAARSHFQLACDYDALPFRADSRINAMLRTEPQRIPGENLLLFDAAAALATADGTGTCGQESFFEHVHFDFDGRYRLGRAWADQIATLLPHATNPMLSQEACEQLLGLSPWNRANMIHLMDERMQMPPLSSQPNNSGRRSALQERLNRLRPQCNQDNAARTRQSFLELLDQRSEDYFLLQEYALFLELSGDVTQAASEWRRYCALMPHDSLGYYQAGRMLNAQQQYAEAEPALRIATTIRPNRTDAWVELGNALLFQKKYADALACYSTAQNQDSRNAQLLIYRGKALSALNRHWEARDSYRAALRLNGTNALAHHELAVELTLTGEPEIAGNELAEAARLSPDNLVARLDYGLWLMQRRRWDAAQQEFEAVLRLDPGNQPAQQNLALLRGLRIK
jgi:tetratricopeptide (TPR) repeat protein